MSVYNEKPEWLRKSIESILCQTYSKLEYIIILDNPHNEELKNIILEYQQKDSRIVFLENSVNKGLVYSLNKGIKEASGKYIARMDADDWAVKERLEQQYICLKENKVDFVMSNVDFFYEDEYVPGSQVPALDSKQFVYMLQYGDVSLHPTWFLKKEIYDTLNGYRYITHCEDLDFLLRAVQNGYKCFRMKEHLVCYRLRQNGVTKKNGLEQYVKAEKLRAMFKKKNIIAEILPESLEKLKESYQETEKEYFAKANLRLDLFVKALNNKRFVQCCKLCVIDIIRNKYYRNLFFRALEFRIRLLMCTRKNI